MLVRDEYLHGLFWIAPVALHHEVAIDCEFASGAYW
jgi:hypothetical protein